MTNGSGLLKSALRWFLIMGAAGFAAGFFGPIAFDPGANQGPLLGIFITGPAGALLGLLLYAICLAMRVSDQRQWQILGIASTVLVVVSLLYCFPEPQLRGELIAAQVHGCKPPAQQVDTAIAYWQKRVAQVTWASPRPNWQADARQMSAVDDGAVLDVVVVGKNRIYERMKPWNKGQIVDRGWEAANEPKSYYVQFPGSCADYTAGAKSVGFAVYDVSNLTSGAQDWPPKKVPDFLDLQTLAPVPNEYRNFIGVTP